MKQDFIDTLFDYFSQDNKKKQYAVDMLFEYIYFNLREFGIFYRDEDTRSDFLVLLYPQLKDIIEKYNPSLSLFSTYLRMILKFRYRVFEREKYKTTMYITIAQAEQQKATDELYGEYAVDKGYEIYAAATVPEYSITNEQKQQIQNTTGWNRKKDVVFKRKLLLLACKSCFLLNDDLIEYIAETVNMPVLQVRHLIDETRRQSKKKDARYRYLVEKRDFYYMRYKYAVMQLHEAADNHYSLIDRMEKQRVYSYRCWQQFLKKANEYTHTPSNRALAKQFGLSRGTIDSNLAVLKKACYGEA